MHTVHRSEAWWVSVRSTRKKHRCVSWPHIRLYISTWTVCTACVRWWSLSCMRDDCLSQVVYARLQPIFYEDFQYHGSKITHRLDKIKLILCRFKLALVKIPFFGYGINRKTKSWNTRHDFTLSAVVFDQVGFSRKLQHINILTLIRLEIWPLPHLLPASA